MKNLIKSIRKTKIQNYAIILDNLSCHKTDLLKEFYKNEKINIIFNSPYRSDFNCIEFFFRLLKQKVYNKLFSSVEEVVNDIKSIIENTNLERSLLQNYRETLENYLAFAIKNKDINLNNLDY